MARSTDLWHELTTGKPPAPRQYWLSRRVVRELVAVLLAGGLVLTLHMVGGFSVLVALLTAGAFATPILLVVATLALKPARTTRALDAAIEDTRDDT